MMKLWQVLTFVMLCFAASLATAGGIDPNDPRANIESYTPTLLKTSTDTEVSLKVRNTGVQTSFRVEVGTPPSGWSVINLTPGSKSISNNKTATFKLQINPFLNVAQNVELPVKIYGDDVFGFEVLVQSTDLIFEVKSPPLAFSIGSPAEDEVLEGQFIIGWSTSTFADTYTLDVKKLNGNVPINPSVLNVTGITDPFYVWDTAFLQKGAQYQIVVTAVNAVGSTPNLDGPRHFSVQPAPPLGAFFITTPSPNDITGINPSFAWTASTNATSYRFSVYGEFNGQPATGSAIRTFTQTGLSYQWANPPLARGNNYYVAVAAIGEAEEKGSSSGLVKFSIPAIEDFTLLSPDFNQQKVYLKTSFRWNIAVGAQTYVISIYDENAGNHALYVQGTLAQSVNTPEFFLPAEKPLLPGHHYSWEVFAYSGSQSKRNADGLRFFDTIQMTPFDLLTPATNQKNVLESPLFTWESTPGVAYYNVQVATANGSGGPNEGQTQLGPAVSGTTWQSTFAPFIKGNKYFWRVFATDGANSITNYGDWQPFIVDPLTDFLLSLPNDTAEDIEISPILDWETVPLATGYVLYISIPGSVELAPIFVSGNNSGVDLMQLGIRLNGDTTYAWTVDALADGSVRRAMEARTFTTTFRTADQFDSCDVIDHLIGREQFSAFDRLVLGINTPPLDASYYNQYMAIPDREPCER